jgi:acetyltransferase-like isoleucine patch superfamily enzyme
MYSGIGHNVSISPNATIGRDVRIGDGTVIHEAVEIGDGTFIGPGCIIGEPLSDFFFKKNYTQPRTVIGPEAVIRSHTVIYAGSSFGEKFQTGHHAVIREYCHLAEHCVVGTFSDLQGHVTMGRYSRLHSNVHLAKGSVLGEFVFIYPFAVLTNDRFPPTTKTIAPMIGDYTQVGVHAVILAGVRVGEHCLIAANAKVTQDAADHSFLIGSPAIRKKDVRELKDDEGNALYPWPSRFSRGMPWENDL